MNEQPHRSGFAAIVGRPNVGKSTLLNQIIGQKVAIISDKPQTTRNRIVAVYTSPAAQVIFLDTPGIHKPQHKLGEYMVEVSRRSFREVDVILHVVDVTAKYGSGEEYILNILRGVKTPVFLVLNKIDLISKSDLLPLIAEYRQYFDFREIIPVSALRQENVGELLQSIIKCLPEGPQYYPEDTVTDQPERFVMAELIREKVLQLTREEVPHAIAVVVEDIKPRTEDLIYVGAVIYTERDSQKGILIGREGKMLKEIGRLARQDIENLLGSKVFLELWVKVKKDWRDKQFDLRQFGYHPER